MHVVPITWGIILFRLSTFQFRSALTQVDRTSVRKTRETMAANRPRILRDGASLRFMQGGPSTSISATRKNVLNNALLYAAVKLPEVEAEGPECGASE
ncbi:hypothetical protein BKA67DRAFT_568508 [Truncatella angustata]|uniref:Secreted protein n=1 Tax=Truncatella angustata TaxID=152316 RepID=A0A9P8UIY4_9PEZI|nr:uncharacterized protein BKA67DRAFT_568508 [Truncatella angustata]KAH6653080.1 hypothetical protein BKA67DRAFT_568508 [Truncatella angustata]